MKTSENEGLSGDYEYGGGKTCENAHVHRKMVNMEAIGEYGGHRQLIVTCYKLLAKLSLLDLTFGGIFCHCFCMYEGF